MQRSQARARFGASPSTPSAPNMSSTLLRFTEPHPSAPGPVRRTRAIKGTGAQRNHLGRRSEWAASQNYRNAVTIDSRWSK